MALCLHLERALQPLHIRTSWVTPLQQQHLDGQREISEFSSGLKAVIILFITAGMRNSKRSCPGE